MMHMSRWNVPKSEEQDLYKMLERLGFEPGTQENNSYHGQKYGPIHHRAYQFRQGDEETYLDSVEFSGELFVSVYSDAQHPFIMNHLKSKGYAELDPNELYPEGI